jgi:hypothetical protein
MPCYRPLQAWQQRQGCKPVFKPKDGYLQLFLPCGQCIGCRLEHSRQWALRCEHEASLHDDNMFLTLTYDDEYLPKYKNLIKSDIQKFIKNLRYLVENSKNSGILEEKGGKTERTFKYYYCGEYGDETERPHYHALIFGFRVDDLETYKRTFNGDILYNSEKLNKCWKRGNVIIGHLTFESAAYTARYCLKKIGGKKRDEIDENTGLRHYEIVDPETAEIIEKQPEFAHMSLKRPIGKEWYEKYKNDLIKDFITSRNIKMKPPKYYDTLIKREGIDGEVQLWKSKKKRKEQIEKLGLTEELLFTNRNEVKEQVKIHRALLLKRLIE